ncbi:general transcription factor 3C polypeptide 1 isoform X2 [Bombina bombina]|uniref:general transcription factor 3C polypeptide 1 isoform X2 n=1 Tax=Bombina bombina TaxID=8345 RepID=UPI00235ADF90|nr:general transcription factor 3C polypeptide 1 isoform X2 [Bombina bombina]
MDVLEIMLEEVALEGLDGITLNAFWLRLQTRVPPFPLLLDDATKGYLWQTLAGNPELEFFQLPKERPPLVLNDRYEDNDCEATVLITNEDSTVDIYPVHIISDNKDGLQGSCQYFKERVSVTEHIRTKAVTYEDAVKRWRGKLVIVASQGMRLRALIGCEGDPEIELPDYSYCLLERVGRSRGQGELQKDLQGSFKVDAGKVHYLRRALDKNGLITMQSHIIRLPNGLQQHSLLLLLKRYHTDRRSKYDLLSEKLCGILSASVNQTETLLSLKEQLGETDRVFKRLYHYLSSAGIVKVLSLPLHEVQPMAEPRKNKKGQIIKIRCLNLLKEYKRRVEEFEDEEDEDGIKSPIAPTDIIYEKDILTQTYELIENRGTKGISQSEIRIAMNVGKLEARMLCRLLERFLLIKGFMEDEGRQRTTKFISHVFVEESELRRQYLEEKAKSEKLCTLSSVITENAEQTESLDENPPVAETQNSDIDNAEDLKDCETGGKRNRGSFVRQISSGSTAPKATPRARSRRHAASSKDSEKAPTVSENECSTDSFQLEVNLSADEDEDDVSVVEQIVEKQMEKKKKKGSKSSSVEKNKETYRQLKRRNIIVEAVKNLRLIESLFTIQKMIIEQEKQEGVATKCCRKSILRLVQRLSQEGLLRLYRTTVVQDSVSKKVDLVVHPSISPSDPLVKSTIEQIRYRISNSISGNRPRSSQEPHSPSKSDSDDHSRDKSKEDHHSATSSQKDSPNKLVKKTDQKMGVTPLRNYHPVIVPGLGRTLGYLPKMPKLKVTHMFLWYIVYGHPLHKNPQQSFPCENPLSSSNTQGAHDDQTPVTAQMASNDENLISQSVSADGNFLSHGDEQMMQTVYVDENSWLRYVPPTKVHIEYGPGWALISDILLCMPLSVFIQIVQVSYKVDNIEDFLNHPVKKHTLIRHLPRPMRQQLLYKRRYIFSVYNSLQKLSCMGLLQFAPIEKFQDKDLSFLYVKKRTTVVDTTVCDPHYNRAVGSHPFEKRSHSLETMQDVENYWFNLQFVCLNTPLGVVRCTRGKKEISMGSDENLVEQDIDVEGEDAPNLVRKYGFLESVLGSREVTDDGSVPGDGMGAGGLDSSFFSHLKRNWIWISYIIKHRENSQSDKGLTLRLQTFLNKHTLPLCSAGNLTSFFGDPSLAGASELVKIVKESSENRNKRVSGGKNQKRKRPKSDTGKKQKAKKKKSDTVKQKKMRRYKYHDEADQSALQRMTRLRVAWTAQEDGLLVLCRIASNILNKKVKRLFVPWQVVRDILHSSIEQSLDKTSHSVGRRARYIMKNPQTYLNYKVCLAEVYQDKALVEEFMRRKGNYDDLKVCAEEFKDFVERLKQKFSTALGHTPYEVPDTVHELYQRYRILAVADETNQDGRTEAFDSVDEVHLLVLQNLILSTLALSDVQMKSCRSLQTFRMYREYKDDILVKAFLQFQRNRLVNRRRVNHLLGPKKSRALPFVPMSYQLSQIYYKVFTWRFPSTICSESFHFLETLKACGDADEPDMFGFGDTSRDADEGRVLFPLDGPGGCCITILSLLFMGMISVHVRIPEQIVVVDSRFVDSEVMKRLGKESLEDEEYDDGDEAVSNKYKLEVNARQASHTNYLLMRGYCVPGITTTRNLSPSDNIVVNSCQVQVKLRKTAQHSQLGDSGSMESIVSAVPCLPPRMSKFLNYNESHSFEKFLNDCEENLGYSTKDLSSIIEIQAAISACTFTGMTLSDLGRRFYSYEDLEIGRTRCLRQYIQDLVTNDQVLQVGGLSIRLVALAYGDPWLLHSGLIKEQSTPEQAVVSKDCNDPESAPHDIQNQKEDDEPPKKRPHLESSDTASPTDLGNPETTDHSIIVNDSLKLRPDTGESTSETAASIVPTMGDSIAAKDTLQPRSDTVEQNNVDQPVVSMIHTKDSTTAENEPLTTKLDTGERDHLEKLELSMLQLKDSNITENEPLTSNPHTSEQGDKEKASVIPTKDSTITVNDPLTLRPDIEKSIAKLHKSGTDCCFLGRPWRVVDGSLNKPVCKGMLEAVVYHIMTKPGIQEASLIQHYSGILHPFIVMELLQVLQDVGCIKKYYTSKVPKVSLFSPTVIPQMVDNPKLCEETNAYYEPTIDCIMRLGSIFPSEVNWNKWVL